MSTIVEFGSERQLLGILSGDAGEPSWPVLVLPSAGLQPRAGPFRLHVELAERLAAVGIRSFRFDVPGVGESPRVSGYDDASATLAAVDELQARYDCSQFVVGGICSAADAGWKAAVADARITAVLMLDGVCFTGPWYQYARTVDRLRRLPHEWRRMLKDAGGRPREGTKLESVDFRDWPSHADAREQFATLVSRGVRQLWIYTGGYTDRFQHPRQFGWTFGEATRSPMVGMHYWPDCDHTFYARAHRDRLIGTVSDWLVGMRQSPGARP